MRNSESRLSVIKAIGESFGIKTLNSRISACKSLLSENAAVNVAVIGKFKAGKSSFLNSLAGRDILPTGVVPVTAVVTELYWSPEETAFVKLASGETLSILPGDIAAYVNEELNPKNRRGAVLAAVGLPSFSVYKGVRFVDTPGLDSALRHNTETSLNWLPNAGLTLVTISADSPLSEQDIELIEKTRSHSPGTIILLTKADRLSPEEMSQVLNFMRAKLKDRSGRDIPVFPFSIKEGFAALREEFRDKALIPFAANIGAERDKIIAHKLGSLESQCREYLLAAKAAAKKNAEERKKLLVLAGGQKARLDTLRNDFKAIFARTSEHCRQEIEKMILAHAPALEKELKTELRDKLLYRRMNLLEMTRAYSGALERFFADKTVTVYEAEKNRLERLARDSSGPFAATAGDFSARLSLEAEKALGVRLPQSRWEPRPEKLPAPDVRIAQAFDSHLELLWFLIPAGLFRKAFIKLRWSGESRPVLGSS